jgi:LacI family transcriptional regulator
MSTQQFTRSDIKTSTTQSRKRTTVKDVALRAGVGQPSVSVVLNGAKSGMHIAPATRQRIMQAAVELGYQPNNSARAMKTGRFGCVGLLMSTSRARGVVQEHLLEGIHDELALHDQHLMLVKSPDESLTDEAAVPRLLREWMVDGLLVAFNISTPPNMIEIIRRHRIPSIWLNADHEVDCVRPSDEDAGYMAAHHLLEMGHRRIAYVGDKRVWHYSIAQRQNGYQRAMRAARAKPLLLNSSIDTPRPQKLKDALGWLQSPDRPTAMIFYSQETAQVTFYAAESLGLRIPQELSLLTFGENQIFSPCTALDTMVIPFREVGQLAVRQLLHKIENPVGILPLHEVPFSLMRGDTNAPPAAAS